MRDPTEDRRPRPFRRTGPRAVESATGNRVAVSLRADLAREAMFSMCWIEFISSGRIPIRLYAAARCSELSRGLSSLLLGVPQASARAALCAITVQAHALSACRPQYWGISTWCLGEFMSGTHTCHSSRFKYLLSEPQSARNLEVCTISLFGIVQEAGGNAKLSTAYF
jgi:hypothetical protein